MFHAVCLLTLCPPEVDAVWRAQSFDKAHGALAIYSNFPRRIKGGFKFPVGIQIPRSQTTRTSTVVEDSYGPARTDQRRHAGFLGRAGRPHLGGPAGSHRHHLGASDGGLACLCRAARRRPRARYWLRLRRPHARLCAPLAPPVAWRRWTSPVRCWRRERRAPRPPVSPMSIGARPIPPQRRWTNTICRPRPLAQCSSATRSEPSPICVAPPTRMREWRSCAGGRFLKTPGWKCR